MITLTADTFAIDTYQITDDGKAEAIDDTFTIKKTGADGNASADTTDGSSDDTDTAADTTDSASDTAEAADTSATAAAEASGN